MSALENGRCGAVEIVQADLARPEHQRDVVALTVAYAADPMGGSQRLPQDVVERLIPGLRQHPTTLIFLAYLDGAATGIATCFRGFSTFSARPVINVHDLAVLPEHRAAGIGRALLQAVERNARESGCGKITLEVQENNIRARRVYEAAGFTQASCGEANGGALFYAKAL
jgi:GNAT superfamily N-acetyltransferase